MNDIYWNQTNISFEDTLWNIFHIWKNVYVSLYLFIIYLENMFQV